VPFSPLGRGFLTGAMDSAMVLEDSDYRLQLPRFSTESRQTNQRIVELLREVATAHNVGPAHVALAWVLAQGEHIIPKRALTDRRSPHPFTLVLWTVNTRYRTVTSTGRAGVQSGRRCRRGL
jgi:diketogulonate reductase-like aldo/keto reductase